MEDIEFLQVEEGLRGSPKATIHKNGRLGFNRSAEVLMNLNEEKRILVGKSKETDILFLKIVDSEVDIKGTAFELKKMQDYFYINTKVLFDTVLTDYKYKEDRITFELNKEGENNSDLFKMISSTKKR